MGPTSEGATRTISFALYTNQPRFCLQCCLHVRREMAKTKVVTNLVQTWRNRRGKTESFKKYTGCHVCCLSVSLSKHTEKICAPRVIVSRNDLCDQNSNLCYRGPDGHCPAWLQDKVSMYIRNAAYIFLNIHTQHRCLYSPASQACLYYWLAYALDYNSSDGIWKQQRTRAPQEAGRSVNTVARTRLLCTHAPNMLHLCILWR